MTLPQNVYFGIWGTLLLGYLALTYKHYDKWQRVLADLGEEIISYNVRNGYGRRNGVALAKGFVYPWRGEGLTELASAKGVSVMTYENELKQNVNKPIRPMAGFLFHILALGYLVLGLTYLTPGAFLSPTTFLIIAVGLLIVSVVAYIFT